MLRSGVAAPKARTVLDHVVLEMRDPLRSAAFYADMFGFAPVRLAEFEAGEAPFASARVSASLVVDLFPPSMWRARTPQNPSHLCFALDNLGLRALERRLERSGVLITHRDGHNFGARGFGASIYFSDPDEITLEARCYPSRS
jgi:catechol 2,3-dioxygenase-like lactoylglutathione lyase family enzyme